MRDIHTSIEQRLLKRVQAGNDAVRADLWISRPTIPLTEDRFLERQVVPGVSASAVSVAVEHPRTDSDASAVFIAYIENGTAKVRKAVYQTHMEAHVWVDTGFSEPADAVSICFDGTMPKSLSGRSEFVTEDDPWVFWVSGGKLYTRKLNSPQATTLADGNCTSVSAVRAVWSEVSKFNFGLVVFFLLNGRLYYRQRIDRVWTDAEMVSFGPAGVLWSDIAAFRTWDYRVGVQALSQDGYLYELFTQFMGIGTRSSEHFELKGAASEGELTAISYLQAKHSSEHFTVSTAYSPTLYGGNYELGPIEALEVWNTEDSTGDWGKYIHIRFSKEVDLLKIREEILNFSFIDSTGIRFYPVTAHADYTGRVISFEFVSINNAIGELTVSYTLGTVSSMAGEPVPEFSFSYTPVGLVPVEGLPEVLNLWNDQIEPAEGRLITVQFDKPVSGELNEKDFTVLVEQRVYSIYPDGTLMFVEVPFIALRWHPTEANAIQFEFGSGNANSLQKCAGRIAVQYIGNSLYGEKGAVLSFFEAFVPVGIAYRGDASDGEHFTIANATTTSSLKRVYYSSYTSEAEHFMLVNAESRGILTHIDDI